MPETEPLDDSAFANLMTDHWSAEFKATRRNLIYTSFVVILVAWLNVSPKEVTVFGVNLTGDADRKLFLLVEVLLVYWSVLFVVYALRDNGIYRERRRQLEEHLPQYRQYIAGIDEQSERAGKQVGGQGFARRKRVVDRFDELNARNTLSQNLAKSARILELLVPAIMAVAAHAIVLTAIFAVETPQ